MTTDQWRDLQLWLLFGGDLAKPSRMVSFGGIPDAVAWRRGELLVFECCKSQVVDGVRLLGC